jgi:hypothetical protein
MPSDADPCEVPRLIPPLDPIENPPMEPTTPPDTTQDPDELDARRLTYNRLAAERDRLRGARAFFARQLGPLPAIAGLSLAAVGVFAHKIQNHTWLWIALAAFAAMVVVSIFYSRMPSYRELRAARRATLPGGQAHHTPRAWYDAEITLEQDIYSCGGTRCAVWWPLLRSDCNMQRQMMKERFGVVIVQLLFLLVVVSLVLARGAF